jgi:hypothetical protein
VIALLRKDLPWLLGFLNAGAIALAIVLGSEPFVQVWTLPPSRLEGLFHAGWIAGAALGLCAAVWDELFGTRDWLRHRPVSPRRLHGSRLLGCGFVLAGWFTVPVGVVWLLEAALGHNVDQLQPANLAEVWATLLPAVTATAIGLFAGTLPCGPLLRLLAGAAALLAVFTAIDSWTKLAADRALDSLPAFAALHAGAAAAFALAGFASAGRDADSDRPWPLQSLIAGGGVALCGFALTGALVVGVVQLAFLDRLLVAYPQVVSAGGTLQLAVQSHEGGRNRVWPVDGDHRRTGAELQGTSNVAWAGGDRGAMEPGFDAPRFHSARTSSWRYSCPLFEDGRAFLVRDEGFTGRVTVVPTGKGPAREPFTADARVLDDRTASGAWVAEPAAGALWRLDPAQQFFVPVPLPGGDRLLAVDSVRPDREDPRRRLEVGEFVYELRSAEHTALVGERGVYAIGGDAVAPAPEWMHEEARKRQRRGQRWERLDPDVLSPRIAVRVEAGDARFEHQYAPRTATERAFAGLALGGSLLRPPALAALAHAFAPAGPQRDPLLDPLLAGGRRPLLLLGNLLAGASCAFLLRRRLRAARIRWWMAACLLLGPCALLAGRLVERARAWAPDPAAAVPPAPPRIASPVSA